MKTHRFIPLLIFLFGISLYTIAQNNDSAIVNSLKKSIENNTGLKMENDSLKKQNAELTMEVARHKDKWNKYKDVVFAFLILVFITALVIILLKRANQSRKDMLDRASQEGEVIETTNFLMKQTLGLPQGSIRGIIALVIATTFVSAIFYYGSFTDVPDSFKIIVSLVFGYYFSKKEGQTKDVIDAMLGKTKRQALKKQEAGAALAEARAQGAPEYATELYEKAKTEAEQADHTQAAADAIAHYNKAIKLAKEADAKAKENKRMAEEKRASESRIKYDELQMDVNRSIGDLREIKTPHNIIAILEDFVETANAEAQLKNFEQAVNTLNKAQERIEVLLADYKEAEEQLKKLGEEKREKIENDLNEALDTFDNSFVKDIKGDNTELIESLVRMQGQIKEQDEALVPVFRKRIMGDVIEAGDIVKIYNDIKNRGDEKLLKSLFGSAADHLGVKINDAIRDKVELPDVVEKLLFGSEEEKDGLFLEVFNKNSLNDKDIFKKLLNKAKEELVDVVIGDSMKKAIPEGIPFQSIVDLIDGAKNDKGEKGVSSTLDKILNVGETILNFTPIGGLAKTASVVIKGIFKIFGKKKRKRS